MKKTEIPAVFFERLKKILPEDLYSSVVETYVAPDPITIRVNTLKSSCAEVVARLGSEGAVLTPVSWSHEVFEVTNMAREVLSAHALLEAGAVYQQSFSSLLPAVLLSPKPGDRVLDTCAAPGSKTTQMAALMKGEGLITAVEAVKERFYRLKAVVTLLGVSNIEYKLMDARRFEPRDGLYDRVLVDAPCSSEGRFKTFIPKTFAYWSPRKIKEMSHKQKGILLSASRALKPGGELVYSTCTCAPEENEEVVDWFLRKNDSGFMLSPAELPGVVRYPAVQEWNGRAYKNDVSACVRVLPNARYSGFFMAKFIKG
ncbi:MAG: RsmB/NOP family class I SAM-dependent RNA methyltransferase [Candidatus Omnitrophica bacterium]|nr:RsmB/NOP family class I SAM-dependent RNA methyltransferase [Candidatus Omnitrophota bacterium]